MIKADRVRAEISVSAKAKKLALILSILEDDCYGAEREHIVRTLVQYFRVSL